VRRQGSVAKTDSSSMCPTQEFLWNPSLNGPTSRTRSCTNKLSAGIGKQRTENPKKPRRPRFLPSELHLKNTERISTARCWKTMLLVEREDWRPHPNGTSQLSPCKKQAKAALSIPSIPTHSTAGPMPDLPCCASTGKKDTYCDSLRKAFLKLVQLVLQLPLLLVCQRLVLARLQFLLDILDGLLHVFVT